MGNVRKKFGRQQYERKILYFMKTADLSVPVAFKAQILEDEKLDRLLGQRLSFSVFGTSLRITKSLPIFFQTCLRMFNTRLHTRQESLKGSVT